MKTCKKICAAVIAVLLVPTAGYLYRENQTEEISVSAWGVNTDYVKTNYAQLTWEVSTEPSETAEPTEPTEPTETEVPPTEQEIPTEEPAKETTEPLPSEIEWETLKFTAYAQSVTVDIAYRKQMTWTSSDRSVAEVKDGVITAMGNGSAVIYADNGSQHMIFPVEVSYDCELNQTRLSLYQDEHYQLEVYSSDGYKTYTPFASWSSSDERVAKINENGVVTAVSSGTAQITANVGNVSAVCTVLVEEIPETACPPETEPEKQILKLTEYTESASLKIDYSGDIIWLSSDTSVATVKDGVVTAAGNGTATIYAICGEQRVEVPVQVTFDYYLNQTELSINAGEQYQLEFHSANNKEIYNQLAVWTSSDESIVKVDSEGILTAVSEGTAEITAKAGDVSAVCRVTVSRVANPEISAVSRTIKAGDSLALEVTDYQGTVTWISSDTSVAKISADGTLTGIKAGEAAVFAMLDNGKTLTVNITVTEETNILPGDVTLDGKVNILDVISVNKAALGKETLTAEQVQAADINHNSVPDAVDSLTIMKFIVGLIPSLNA